MSKYFPIFLDNKIAFISQSDIKVCDYGKNCLYIINPPGKIQNAVAFGEYLWVFMFCDIAVYKLHKDYGVGRVVKTIESQVKNAGLGENYIFIALNNGMIYRADAKLFEFKIEGVIPHNFKYFIHEDNIYIYNKTDLYQLSAGSTRHIVKSGEKNAYQFIGNYIYVSRNYKNANFTEKINLSTCETEVMMAGPAGVAMCTYCGDDIIALFNLKEIYFYHINGKLREILLYNLDPEERFVGHSGYMWTYKISSNYVNMIGYGKCVNYEFRDNVRKLFLDIGGFYALCGGNFIFQDTVAENGALIATNVVEVQKHKLGGYIVLCGDNSASLLF